MNRKAYAYELREFNASGDCTTAKNCASNSARYIQRQRPNTPPPDGVQRFETINGKEAGAFLFINNLY